jgi:acyl-CoA thioesterase
LLDDSLAIATAGTKWWVAAADPSYEANTGMFGGWTAALLLKAVLEHPDRQGAAAGMTVNFIERIVPGEALSLRVRRLGGGRSLAHWRCDVHRAQADALLATASIVLAHRRNTEQAIDFKMPVAPAPQDIPLSNPPGRFGRTTETRMIEGTPPFNRSDMGSLGWVRESSGRQMDPIQLAYLSDVYAPRVFHISAGPRQSSTVSLSIAFLAGPEEIAAIGDDYILAEVEGTRVEQGLVGSRSRLWGPLGTLLATSEQLCWFR